MTVYRTKYTNILSGTIQYRRFISEDDAKEFCERSGGTYFMVNENEHRGVRKYEQRKPCDCRRAA